MLISQDIDRELKRACEHLITHCARVSTLPLREFIDRCTAYLQSRPAHAQPAPTGSGASDLASQPFATPSKVQEAHDLFRVHARERLEGWKSELRRYLGDEDTVGVLVPPAQVSLSITAGVNGPPEKLRFQNAIVDVYRQFHDLVRAEYEFSTAAGLMTPSALAALLSTPVSTLK
jgi:hypothetical protein